MIESTAHWNRWRQIGLYAGIAVVLAFPLGEPLRRALESFLSPIPFPLLRSFCFVAICAGALLFLAKEAGVLCWQHFRFWRTYPPTLTAVPLALWVLLMGTIVLPCESRTALEAWTLQLAFLGASLLLTILTVVTAIRACAASPKPNEAPPPTGAAADLETLSRLDFEQLKEWLDSEVPIAEPSQDYFEADYRAQRLAEALRTRRLPKDRELRQTVVIQGAFGSGKTGLVNLAKRYVKSQCVAAERFIFVEVKCWGFSSAAAQGHVLERAVAALGQHVDCLALRRMPAAYAAALGEAGSWFSGLAHALGGGGPPLEQLRRFTPVLRAINSNLVIVVEDTDRNGPDFDQKDIEAMLHNFRDVERVSFVLTAGRDSHIDFAKIAEHHQFLLPLPTDRVLALLDRVREHCRTSEPFIDPLEGTRELNRPQSMLGYVRSMQDTNWQVLRGDKLTWPEAVAALLDAPRRLKLALRDILQQWQALRGEIDIDELIMLTALRHGASPAYNFFGSHFAEFSNFRPWKNQNLSEDQKSRFATRKDELKAGWRRAVEESGIDGRVIGTVFYELVPASGTIIDMEVSLHGNRNQSLARQERAGVYWERLTLERVPPRQIRDQKVLRIMHDAANANGAMALGEAMAESAEFVKIAYFLNSLSVGIQEKWLLHAVSTAFSRLHPFDRSDTFHEILKWLSQFDWDMESRQPWLRAEINACALEHLDDAFVLITFARNHILRNAHEVIGDFCSHARASLSKLDADQFGKCLHRGNTGALSTLINEDEPPTDDEEKRRRFENMGEQLSSLLLQSVERQPAIMQPQVALAFGKWVHPRPNQPPMEYNFDREKMEWFFGDKLPQLIGLMAREVIFSAEAESWLVTGAPFATQAAVEWAQEIASAKS